MEFIIQMIKLDQARIEALSQKIDVQFAKIKTHEKNEVDLQKILLSQSDELNRTKELVLALEQSTSWRITSPLRWLSRIVR